MGLSCEIFHYWRKLGGCERSDTPIVASTPKRRRIGRFDSYTPLNASRDAITQEACNLELVYLPQPMQTPPSINHTKNVGIIKTVDTLPRSAWRFTVLLKSFVLGLLLVSFNTVKKDKVVDEKMGEKAINVDAVLHREDKVVEEDKLRRPNLKLKLKPNKSKSKGSPSLMLKSEAISYHCRRIRWWSKL